MSFLYEERCTVIVKVKEFSIVPPGEQKADFEYCDPVGRQFMESYGIVVFSNGCKASMKGSISVHFLKWPHLESMMRSYGVGIKDARLTENELSCIISVVDCEGVRRFPQTFVFRQDFIAYQPEFRIDNYISHSALVNESSELLPKDTLTLHMDIVFKKNNIRHYFEESLIRLAFQCFEMRSGADDELSYSLYLESPLAELLAQDSPYFQRIMVTPMVERRTKLMKVTDDSDHLSLVSIGRILRGDNQFSFNSVDDILKLYETSDKFDIPTALEICKRWLVLCMCRGSVRKISELADRHGDDYLRKAVADFLDGGENADSRASSRSFVTNTDDEWTFHVLTNGPTGLYFTRGLDVLDDGLVNLNISDSFDSFDFYT